MPQGEFPPKKIYPLVFEAEDGCQLLVHGKEYEDGWKIDLPGGIKVTCPHGKSSEITAIPKAKE